MIWQPVMRATYIRKDRLLLLLACGHETTIEPVETTAVKQRELLESSVPCPICSRYETGPPPSVQRRIASGLAEAEQETRVMARSERDAIAWNGDRIVHPNPKYL